MGQGDQRQKTAWRDMENVLREIERTRAVLRRELQQQEGDRIYRQSKENHI